MVRISLNQKSQNFLLYTFLILLWFTFFYQKALATNQAKDFLHSLIREKKIALAKEFLKKNTVKIQHQDSQGNTALHYAIMGKHLDLIKNLLEKKANFLLKNKQGLSAKDLAHNLACKEIDLLLKKQIEKNRERSKSFSKIYNKVMEERAHCCRFYGKLKTDGSIRALIQKTMPNGDCALGDYNPPHKNLFSGDCNTNKTLAGCRGHTQTLGICEQECGWGSNPPCQFNKTF